MSMTLFTTSYITAIALLIQCSAHQTGSQTLRLDSATAGTQRPIIGVLAQDSGAVYKKYGNSFIDSPYAGYLEQAGARVVAVRIDQSQQYYKDLFNKINGVLFPGGGADVVKSGYAKAAKMIYRMAIDANDKGDHFPLWGTCLGFQELSVLRSEKNLLYACPGVDNMRLPLNFTSGLKDSRLFREMPQRLQIVLAETNITFNSHENCLGKKTFYDNTQLSKFYRVISINKDANGKEFISSMEAYNYPFYGIQWHAEKNNWNWDPTKHIDHSLAAVQISQYMANFFVQSARNSSHHFSSPEEESEHMIERGPSVYLGEPDFFSLYIYNFTDSNTTDGPLVLPEGLQFIVVLIGMSFLMFTTVILLRRLYARQFHYVAVPEITPEDYRVAVWPVSELTGKDIKKQPLL